MAEEIVRGSNEANGIDISAVVRFQFCEMDDGAIKKTSVRLAMLCSWSVVGREVFFLAKAESRESRLRKLMFTYPAAYLPACLPALPA